MNQTNKGRPDLNLLVVFDAVMRHRQATAAARDLSLSQPAISHALNRLRDLTGDALFLRTPDGLLPTSRALEMAVQVRQILNLAAQVYAAPSFFPEVSERVFHVGVTEYTMQAALPQILPELRKRAPKMRLELAAIGDDTLAHLENGALDCAFWGAGVPPSPFCHVPLYREHFIAFICQEHPLAQAARAGRVSLDQFLAYPHAIVRLAKTGASPMDLALQKLGRKRHIILGSSSFASNLASLPGTDLIFSVPSRFAGIAKDHKLVGFRLPVEMPEFDYTLIWHARVNGDQAALWFRDLIVEMTRAGPEPHAAYVRS